VNRVLEDKALRAGEGARRLLEEFFERRNDWSAQLGLFGQDPATFLLALRDQRAARLNIDVPRVQALLDERAAARAAKDFARSDELRAALAELGVAVRDTVEGQVWDIA
ncbi:MAG: cysteine--tRNA ligase, partial [Desulfovibrio piger]|nr:cysteine--tRNA ligase [Desulfovibrio piger]